MGVLRAQTKCKILANFALVTKICFSLGSNMGASKEYLYWAVGQLKRLLEGEVRVSGLYRTAAWGSTQQPDFLNLCVSGYTTTAAETWLAQVLSIEKEAGRVRTQHWGPRVLDIDILLYGPDQYQTAGLTIPHKHMHERRFVLAPLAEIEPDLIHPTLGQDISTLLAICADALPCHKLESLPLQSS